MKVTKICCDICGAEIPNKELCIEVNMKYLISDRIDTLDLCRNCYGKVVNFMYNLKEAGKENELFSY